MFGPEKKVLSAAPGIGGASRSSQPQHLAGKMTTAVAPSAKKAAGMGLRKPAMGSRILGGRR
jgi:hypothetical protein